MEGRKSALQVTVISTIFTILETVEKCETDLRIIMRMAAIRT